MMRNARRTISKECEASQAGGVHGAEGSGGIDEQGG